MSRDNCKSSTCGAPIIWAIGPPSKPHPEGAALPIDAKPQPLYWPAVGNEPAELPEGLSSRPTPAYEVYSDRGVARARKIGSFHIVRDESKVDPVHVRRFLVSHYATCPDAGKFTKGRK